MTQSDIVARPIVPADWPAIEKLFGRNGACGGCWCMLWQVPSLGRHWEAVKGEPNRNAFRKLVRTGEALGCLAFVDAQPVGYGFGLPVIYLAWAVTTLILYVPCRACERYKRTHSHAWLKYV